MKKHIPNTITSCNLISGCIATSFALQGQLEIALLWIVIGAAFDFFDGMSARLLNVSSPIGKELDSLADVVTFGVAPSTMLFFTMKTVDSPALLEQFRCVLPYSAFIMAAFSALRLAKFNLDERQTLGFIGMPTPANALFWGSVTVAYQGYLGASAYSILILIALMLLFSWLLISEIPMFALKFKHWGIDNSENVIKYGFVVFSAAAIIIAKIAAIAIIILMYIIVSVLVFRKKTH